jgi:competence protein ComFA
LLAPKYFLYLAESDEGRFRVSLSSNPRIDAYFLAEEGFTALQIIKPPLPLYLAEWVLEQLSTPGLKLKSGLFFRMVKRAVQTIQPHRILPPVKLSLAELRPESLDFPDLTGLLQGRILLGTELPELIAAKGLEVPWNPEDWMQYLYFHSRVRREAAVSVDRLGLPFCRRCGATTGILEDDCYFCGNSRCYTCPHCRSMGVAKSCLPLYSQPRSEEPVAEEAILPHFDFELTPPQKRASSALEQFLDGGERQFLVWAVCGGGKTEVSFGAVAKVLSAGGRVLFAVPRKDVVQELEPRFQKAFPAQTLIAVYGGSGGRYEESSLVLATTHQCLRFYQAFDLIILDEEDAFPYFGSEMLHFAVRRALKPQGKLVMMTATPDRELRARAARGEIPVVEIPARPHRRPLIVPQILRTALNPVGRKDWQPPPFLREKLEALHSNGRKLLVFLPTVCEVEQFGRALCDWAQSRTLKGKYVHARTPGRLEAKAALLDGAHDFLVVSTVFERGITIPNLDVVVLNADDEAIFDCRTLVQIAGRVGRMGEAAQVCFAGKRQSRAMHEAVTWISRMNEAGYQLGFLDESS